MKKLKLVLSGMALVFGVFALSGVVAYAEEAPAAGGEGDAAFATLEAVVAGPAEALPSPALPEAVTSAPETPTAAEAGAEDVAPPVADTAAEEAVGASTGLAALQTGALPVAEAPVALDAPDAALPVAAEPTGEGEELAASGDGERNENGKWYYYENGQAVTGWKALADGRLVYYNADGSMHFGERHMDDDKWYYFDPDNGGWQGSWQNFDGRQLYYDWENGMYMGEGQVDGAWRFFSEENGNLTTGMVDLDDGRTVCYDENGMVFGEVYANGAWRYFDIEKNGNMAVGFQRLPDDRLVYYNEDGSMHFGERNMGNLVWYYFDISNGAWRGGLVELPDGRIIYYDWEYGMYRGPVEINGFTYEFSESDGNLRTGWKRAEDGSVYLCPPTYVWPSDSSHRITSYYGGRTHPVTGASDFHLGIDIGAAHGTNVLAAAAGLVTVSTSHWSYGNYIILDHGSGMRTLYAHMSQLLVSVGDYVQQGMVIGLVGATGQVTGPHIHFETFTSAGRVDPLSYF